MAEEEVRQLAPWAQWAHRQLDSRRGYWLAFAVLLAFHLAGELHYYRPATFLHRQAIVSGDFASYFPAAAEARHVWSTQRSITGYSASFMAGYPFGNWGSVGRKGFHLASLLLAPLSVEQAVYLFVVLVLFLVPLLLYGAARLLDAGRLEALGVLAAAVLLMQLDRLIVSLWSVGTLTTFLFGSGLVAIYLGCLHRCLHGAAPLRHGVLGAVTLGAVVFVHPLIVPPLFFAGCVSLALSPAALREGRRLAALAIAAGGGWVLVLPHLLELHATLDQKIAYPASKRFLAGLREGFFDLLMDRAYRLHFDRRLLFQAVVVLAVVGGILAWRRRRHGVLAAALTGFLCLGAAYTFSYVHVLQQTEPYRYVATATLLFAIPAISGLAWILGRLASLGREQRLAVACIALLAVPAATGYLVDLASARNTFRADTLRVTGEVALLREFQPAQARILCESEPLGSVVPWYLGAEVIGGYHSGWFPMTYGLYAHCSDRRVFGLPPDAPDAYNPARLNAYLDLYNVGLVAAHTPALTGAMAADPRWRQVASRSSLALFERASGAPAGYLEGVPAATVERQDGTLVIDGAPPGESLLRYHYLPGMHADGGVALHPIKRLDDPAPFVGIDNPAGLDRITIHLR